LSRMRRKAHVRFSGEGVGATSPPYPTGGVMSEVFEGVVVSADESALRGAFNDLHSHLALRLTRLSPSIFGIYRFEYTEGRLFDLPELEQIAQLLSRKFDSALVVFYDNRAHAMGSALYSGGRLSREFGEADEIWVGLDEDGEPALDGPKYHGDDLPEDFDEGECIRTAIDTGLEAAGFRGVNERELKQAFCYDERSWLAESAPNAGSPTF
jgi:hypothetical protein